MNTVIWSRRKGRTHELLFSLILLVAAAPSCSVKEDRIDCPSLLIVNTEQLKDVRSPHMLHIWGDGTYHFHEKIVPLDYPHEWTARVAKGYNTLTAVTGVDRSSIVDRSVVIQKGNESDRIWTHRSLADCTGEYARDTLSLHKQYCVLTIDMEDFPDYGFDWEGDGLRPEISGRSCGLALDTGEPLAGEFLAYPRYVGGGMFQVILPRQREDWDLVMRLVRDGLVTGSVDIGTIMHLAGYSWDRMDLDDLIIFVRNNNSVDFTGEGGGFQVVDWQFGTYGDPGW